MTVYVLCRWREKLFLLTRDHIHCFKKRSLQGLAHTKDYEFRVGINCERI